MSIAPSARSVISIFKFETAADPLKDDIVRPALVAVVSEFKFEPKATPEIVEFASLSFAMLPASIALLTPPDLIWRESKAISIDESST